MKAASIRGPGVLHHRGVALITVIVVLMALVIIATPFSISMRHHSESATDLLHKTRARKECEALRNLALESLKLTHPGLDSETPHSDAPAEWELDLDDVDLGFKTSDPRGKIWSLDLEDLQGRINLNGVSIYLIATLLGERTRLEEALLEDSISVKVSDTSDFPSDGYLWIDGEAVEYISKTQESFDDIERAALLETLQGIDPVRHPEGTEVLGYRAFLIASHCYKWIEGRFSSFPTLESVRNIAVGNEISLSRDGLDRLADRVTVLSGYPAGRRFVNPQRILQVDRGDPRILSVQQGRYLGPGSIVRIRMEESEQYSMVLRSRRDELDRNSWNLMLQDPIAVERGRGDSGIIDLVARPAVNINTASSEVLQALVTGLALTPEGKKWVSALVAAETFDEGLLKMIRELPLGDPDSIGPHRRSRQAGADQ
ncbi:MAG: hypothetical protein ACYTG7_21320 [Planctomycetota bacterium]|jgi:hypothetical protein